MKKHIKTLLLVMIVLVISILSTNVYAEERVKGDINGDNKVSITDISQLKLHIVGLKEIAIEYQTYADINGDGKISVTDLSKLKMQLVGLGNRNLTDEELNSIKDMIERDFVFWGVTSNFTPESLDYERIAYLTNGIFKLSEQENSYDSELILKLHFGDNGPAGGDVYVCPLEDIVKMYKLIFDIDISREEMINRLGTAYHKEIDAVTYQGYHGGLSYFSINDAYYNDGQYFVNISWYDNEND